MIDVNIQAKIASPLIDLPVLESKIKDYLQKKLPSRNILVELILTDPAEVQALNTKYLDKSAPTDVLSFPIWHKKNDLPQTNQLINLGTIVLNVDQVINQAAPNRRTPTDEAIFLSRHSIDHLLGQHHPE